MSTKINKVSSMYTYTDPQTKITISREDTGIWSWSLNEPAATKKFMLDSGFDFDAENAYLSYYVELGRIIQVLYEKCAQSFGDECAQDVSSLIVKKSDL